MKDKGILDLKPKDSYDDIYVDPVVLAHMQRIGLRVEDLEQGGITFEELRALLREKEVTKSVQKKIRNVWRLVQMSQVQRLTEKLQQQQRRRLLIENAIQANQAAIEANQQLLESDSSDSGSTVSDDSDSYETEDENA